MKKDRDPSPSHSRAELAYPSPFPVEGGGKERKKKKNWKEYTATVEDIQNFLMDRIYLRHNVVTGRVEGLDPTRTQTPTPNPIPEQSSPTRSLSRTGGAIEYSQEIEVTGLPSRSGGAGGWVPLSDRIVNSLWAEMSAGEKQVRVQDMYRVIESDFVPEFHPFRYYLEHLPPWDGQSDYILEMSVSVNVREVGRAMTDLGFLRMRSHGERGYVVVAYSADEIKARKRIKACDAKPDEAGAVDTFDAIDTIF